MLHYGQAEHVVQQRQQVLLAAYLAHPERFVQGQPSPPSVPTEVWINPPQPNPQSTQEDLGYQRKAGQRDIGGDVSISTLMKRDKRLCGSAQSPVSLPV